MLEGDIVLDKYIEKCLVNGMVDWLVKELEQEHPYLLDEEKEAIRQELIAAYYQEVCDGEGN